MGKNEKTGLGRALVRQHNQMIIQSKEKGRFYNKQNKKVLESVTEVSDIEAIIERSNEAEEDEDEDEDDADVESDSQLYFNVPAPNLPITLDTGSSIELTPEERREIQKNEEALHASSLQIPRRPPWNAAMSVEELDTNERQAFLSWRRGLARLEENENLVLTPFEKNLDIWRQLWRVVERSDLLVMVVDARDPLFYRCPDLEVYAQEIDPHKQTLLLVNKADLLPLSVRAKWAEYFHLHGILFLFWSAKAASATTEGKPSTSSDLQESENTEIHGKDELLARLQSEAESIAQKRKNVSEKTASNSVIVGFVGYPNVGKSSTINALVGQKRTGVTSTPGKTKHFQTIIISEELTLCDCPGLVFPSFTSSRYEMIASGVLPIDRMTENRAAVQVAADRVPRAVIERVYNIRIPKPKPYEDQSRAPLAAELLRAYCASRNYVSSRGLPDETRAARQILKDYLDGKLPHYQIPPGMTAEAEDSDSVPSGLEILSEDSDEENEPPVDERVMEDLNSFDISQGIVSKKPVKKVVKADKHHKKPQKKKDRTWRVGNEDGDGMPVKVFQKPLVPGPLKTVA